MKNLSVLSIPIATPPTTPPPAGQVYVFFDTEDQLQVMGADGITEPLHLRKYSQRVTLTDSFNIIGVPTEGGDSLVLEGDLREQMPVKTVIRIEGEGLSESQQVKIVSSVGLNDNGNTLVTVVKGNLPTSLVTSGAKLHIAKQVNVEHLLDSTTVTFALRSVETGESVDVADKLVDSNNLLLMPHVPTLGEYMVTLVA